uniref:endo-polygalacturonase n=1 Tax=Lygus hesperus TaxID=30085 RepID=A0A0A9YNS2_LYGHE
MTGVCEVWKFNMGSKYALFACISLMMSVTSAVDVRNIQELAAAKRGKDKFISIKDLHVPAGVTLDLENLQPDTVLEFAGRVTFGFKEWTGPLVKIAGKKVTIKGKRGHLIDGEGARWWDGKGGAGGKVKPKFMRLKLEDSVVQDLHVKNAPVQMFTANNCKNLVITNVNLDNEDGHKNRIGRNTDGFGVGDSKNVTVQNSRVYNQDDCFCCGSGVDIKFINNICIGGNGISIGSMGSNRVVEKLTVRKCKVISSFNGIRIKAKKGEKSSVSDVTFDDIEIKDIQHNGIIIHGNYPTWHPTDEPTAQCPIKNLVVNNVRGTVQKGGSNVWIWLANGAASNWKWNSNVTGGGKKLACKGIPAGLKVPCGK